MVVRELPVEEWHRAMNLGHFKTCGFPDPKHARILVVEDGEQIVGIWFAMNVVHLEGLWVDPAHRGKAGVVRRLLHGMVAFLTGEGITTAFTLAVDPRVVALAVRAGFQRFPGELLVGDFSCQPSPSQSQPDQA